jgi:hypothetical protein
MVDPAPSATTQRVLWLWWRQMSPGGWPEYRRLSSAEFAWFQRFFEAWWVFTGQWSLRRAYMAGMIRDRLMRAPGREEVDSILREVRLRDE